MGHASGGRALNASSACPRDLRNTNILQLRPGRLGLGNGREEARLPTYWMRQLDPERSDCASFGVGSGSNEEE